MSYKNNALLSNEDMKEICRKLLGLHYEPISPSVTLLAENLFNGLQVIMPLIKKSVIIQTNHILITAKVGLPLRLIANNLERQVEVVIPCKCAADFEIAVPAAPLFGLIKEFQAESLSLALENETTLRLEVANLKSRLLGVSGEEFIVKESADLTTCTVDPLKLQSMLRLILPCCAGEDARPALTGVYFESKGGQLTLVAADGYKLAYVSEAVEGWSEWSCIVPNAATLVKLIDLHAKKHKTGFTMTLTLEKRGKSGGGQICFSMGDTETDYTADLIPSEFPKWREVTAQFESMEGEVKVSNPNLLNALKSVTATPMKHVTPPTQVILTFDPNEGGLRLEATNYTATLNSHVTATYVNPVPSSAVFSIAQLKKMISPLGGELTISYGGIDPAGGNSMAFPGATPPKHSHKPIKVITPMGSVHLLMPMSY